MVPGIPSGFDNIDVKIDSNVNANALSVLNNSADIFDWADTIPGSYLAKINSQAKTASASSTWAARRTTSS